MIEKGKKEHFPAARLPSSRWSNHLTGSSLVSHSLIALSKLSNISLHSPYKWSPSSPLKNTSSSFNVSPSFTLSPFHPASIPFSFFSFILWSAPSPLLLLLPPNHPPSPFFSSFPKIPSPLKIPLTLSLPPIPPPSPPDHVLPLPLLLPPLGSTVLEPHLCVYTINQYGIILPLAKIK